MSCDVLPVSLFLQMYNPSLYRVIKSVLSSYYFLLFLFVFLCVRDRLHY